MRTPLRGSPSQPGSRIRILDHGSDIVLSGTACAPWFVESAELWTGSTVGRFTTAIVRILHVIPGLAVSSGPTQVVLSLASAQAKIGDDVTIYHLRDRLDAAERAVGEKVIAESFPVRGLRFWGYAPELAKRLKERISDFDVVHLHSLWCYQNLAVRHASRRASVPYIVRPAGSLEPWSLTVSPIRKRLYLHLFERKVLRDAAALHAMSDREAQELSKIGFNSNVVTVPNGIDMEALTPTKSKGELRTLLDLPTDSPIVLMLGRIHPVKGLEIAGEALVAIRRKMPNALMVIAGPDSHPYAEEVKAFYTRLGVGQHAVRFVGEVDSEEKMQYYGAADVFILPSESENFGNVVVESLASGTPVVVSEGVPWPNLQEWGVGRRVPRAPGAFAEATVELLANPEELREMSARARQICREHFAWESIVAAMRNVYESVAQ